LKKLPTAHEYHLAGCLGFCAAGVIIVGALMLFAAYAIWADWNPALEPVGYIGNAKRGERLISAYGCTSCHELPGSDPKGLVGPPLNQIASQSYLAGHFANHEIWMTQWLEHPQELKPGTAMPDLNVQRRDALDMAAYLATLR
jgi:cytochrome c2